MTTEFAFNPTNESLLNGTESFLVLVRNGDVNDANETSTQIQDLAVSPSAACHQAVVDMNSCSSSAPDQL